MTIFFINRELKLKSNHRYIYQIQMQMFIHVTRTYRFVIWTPNLCFPVILGFDHNFLDQIKILKTFFRKYTAHELVTWNLETNDANTVKAAVVDAPIYCYCKKMYTENDKMIGCHMQTVNVNGFILLVKNSKVHLKVYDIVKIAKNHKKM